MSDVPMTRPQEALVVHQAEENAPSTFVELEDGRVLGAKYDGRVLGAKYDRESSLFTVSDDGGISWSEPVELGDKSGGPVQAFGLVNLSGNAVGACGVTGWVAHHPHLLFWRSEDGGETWEPPVEVTPREARTYVYHDMLLRTSSGRIILPVYRIIGRRSRPEEPPAALTGKLVNNEFQNMPAHYFDPVFICSDSYYSDDDGRSWQHCQDGELVILLDSNATFSHVGEPTVTEVAPGKLLMLLRTSLNRLFEAWSYDNGETWTRPQPTSLASSTAPGQIRSLPNGHLLAVWNQQSEREILQGYGRTRMSAAISRNGGSIWEFFQNLDSTWEETRVEPGPIQRGGPAEYYFQPGVPAPERDAANVTMATEYGYWTYPSVLVLKDRVIIKYSEGDLSTGKIKVLPMSWFYGGQEPADNPFLENPYAPASP